MLRAIVDGLACLKIAIALKLLRSLSISVTESTVHFALSFLYSVKFPFYSREQCAKLSNYIAVTEDNEL